MISVLLSILTVSSGCTSNHRYVYKKFTILNMEKKDPLLSCMISLHGSEQRAGKDGKTGRDLSYLRSPYTVLVSFHFPKDQTGVVELKDISFYENDSMVKSEKVNLKKKFDNKTIIRKGGILQVREEEDSRASFLIRQIEIPHSKLMVTITALISIEHSEILKTWRFEMIPFTEEELRNNLLDSIMSV